MSKRESVFIKLTSDSVFKYIFKSEFKWFYRDIIFEYTGIDINNYTLYDNEINYANKHNKDDYKLDIVLISNDNKKILNIEMNTYDCLKRNEMYLHTLIAFIYKKYNNEKTKMPNVIQININAFDTMDKKSYRYIALRNEENKIVSKNFQFYNYNISILDNVRYNSDKNLQLMMCKSYDEMETIAKGEDRLMGLIKKLKELGQDNEFLKVYDPEADMAFMLESAEDYGRRVGHASGEAAGILKSREQTAKNMLRDGVSINKIKKYTGLSASKIKSFML